MTVLIDRADGALDTLAIDVPSVEDDDTSRDIEKAVSEFSNTIAKRVLFTPKLSNLLIQNSFKIFYYSMVLFL